MAISNFKLPTGLDVSGSATVTGSLDVLGLSNVSTLTASVGVSGAVGYYADLYKNGAAVLTSADLSSYALSADVSSSFALKTDVSATFAQSADVSSSFALKTDVSATFAQSADVSASFVQPSQLTGTVAFLTASNVFTALQQITGGLSMTEDLSARSGTLSGDLTVQGDLTVNGTTTYINTTNLLVEDKTVVIASGSDSSAANNAGIYLGQDGGSEVAKIYYTHADTSWNTDKSLKVSGNLSASALVTAGTGDFVVLTGSTTTGSLATFTQITGNVMLVNTLLYGNAIAATSYGSVATNVLEIPPGGTGSTETFFGSIVGAAKYIVSAKSGSTGVHAIEALLTHDSAGANAYVTSYASVYNTANPLVRINATNDGTLVNLEVENISAGDVTASYFVAYVGQ